jgi:hypothetical protein
LLLPYSPSRSDFCMGLRDILFYSAKRTDRKRTDAVTENPDTDPYEN